MTVTRSQALDALDCINSYEYTHCCEVIRAFIESPPSAPRAEAVEAKDAAPTRAELLTALSAFVNWEGSRNPNGDDTLLPPEKQTRPFLAAAMRLIALAEAEDQRERELFGEYA